MISSNIIKNPLYSKKSNAHFYLSANQTTDLGVGDHFKFDTIGENIGNDIFLDATTTYTTTTNVDSIGRVLLKAGKTYEIECNTYINLSAGGGAGLAIYNSDTNLVIQNTEHPGGYLATTYGADISVSTKIYAKISPLVDTRIEIRIETISGSISSIIGLRDSLLKINTIENITPSDSKTFYAKIEDQKTSGTDGGTFTSGAWQTRDLNTLVTNENGFVGLSSNQFTLPQGNYYIKSKAPAYIVDRHKIKLRNITDSSDIIIGSNAFSDSTNGAMDYSFLEGKFSTASIKTFEIQHRCETTGTSTGFGLADSFSVTEAYTMIELWRY